MDSKIKYFFKNKIYSELDALYNEKSWDDSNDNLGIYFFLLESKGKATENTFNRILEIKKNKELAYCYLGNVAKKLFDDKKKIEAATFFYEKALEHNKENTDVLWALFQLNFNPIYFITAINIDYKEKMFSKISNNISSIQPAIFADSRFNKADFETIKEICLNKNIERRHDLLLISCYYLDDFAFGINVMNEMDWVRCEIVELYLDQGCIDLDYALKKMPFHSRIKHFKDDKKGIYKEAKIEAKTNSINPSANLLIQCAFEAGQYSDVLCLVENNAKNRLIESKEKLYHILSSLYLEQKIDLAYETEINQKNFFIKTNTDELPLYLSYFILINVNKLQEIMRQDEHLYPEYSYPIEYQHFYKDAKECLDHEALLEHYLHDSLTEKLDSLKDSWHESQNDKHILKLESDTEGLNENENELIALSIRYIDKCNYERAILILSKMTPSMSISNYIGLCHEEMDNVEKALVHYKMAFNAMNDHAEMNISIISNYLSALHFLNETDQEPLYNECIDKFNISVASLFRYDTFTAENRNSVYKYYPFNKFTLDSLINNYFYLASSEQLNDPIELPYSHLKNKRSDILLRPDFRLTSFSNNKNSMLMWSHYAENHTGLMIEYCFEGELPEGVGIANVNYSHTAKRYKEKEEYLFDQYMLTKNEDWSYEKEVRLFGYKKEKIYYEQLHYPNRSSEKAGVYIKSIFLGYRFPPSMIKLIINIMNEINDARKNNALKINLYQAKLSETNFFELEYEAIDSKKLFT